MEQPTPMAHKCPSPKECPFGPKVDGYTCLKSFALTEPPTVIGGKPRPRYFCSDSYISQLSMRQIIEDLKRAALKAAAEKTALSVAQELPPSRG